VEEAEVEEVEAEVMEKRMYHHSNRPLCMIECQARNNFANNILGLPNSNALHFH
jgi:hypothetical protein